MKKLTILFSIGFLIFISCVSCGDVKEPKLSNDNSKYKVEIAGTYVRESSNEVINMSSGNVVGNQIIRDTIIIKEKENGFEVSNSKYRLNDYDQFGWTAVGGTNIIPTFQASYDKTDSSLIPVQNTFVSPIYLDLNKKELFKNKDKDHTYKKVK